MIPSLDKIYIISREFHEVNNVSTQKIKIYNEVIFQLIMK